MKVRGEVKSSSSERRSMVMLRCEEIEGRQRVDLGDGEKLVDQNILVRRRPC